MLELVQPDRPLEVDRDRLEDFTHKSGLMRYGNLSLAVRKAYRPSKAEAFGRGREDPTRRRLEISLSATNRSRSTVHLEVTIVGVTSDGRPAWATILLPASDFSFSRAIRPDSTAALRGSALVPLEAIEGTRRLWIQIIEQSAE
jgi:hypothetical protein